MILEVKEQALNLVKDKIKEPVTEEDLNLAGEIVIAKLKIQNRSFNGIDDNYLAILIAETLIQLEISRLTIAICLVN